MKPSSKKRLLVVFGIMLYSLSYALFNYYSSTQKPTEEPAARAPGQRGGVLDLHSDDLLKAAILETEMASMRRAASAPK